MDILIFFTWWLSCISSFYNYVLLKFIVTLIFNESYLRFPRLANYLLRIIFVSFLCTRWLCQQGGANLLGKNKVFAIPGFIFEFEQIATLKSVLELNFTQNKPLIIFNDFGGFEPITGGNTSGTIYLVAL